MSAITLPCSPGDKIGYIYRVDGKWTLIKDEIRKIIITKRGVRIDKTKHFRELDIDDIEENTLMFKKDGIVPISNIFFLDADTEPKAERWVKNANPTE